jgi:hypothetical protein
MAVFLSSCDDTVTGTIAVKGNAPFAHLALTTEHGEFEIEKGEIHDTLWKNYQGSTVTLKVEVIREPQPPMQGLIRALAIID